MIINSKYFALKITSQKELDFVHNLYNFNEYPHFYRPIWIYLDEKYNYEGYDILSAIQPPNVEYPDYNFLIFDVKNLIREEKLKKINVK